MRKGNKSERSMRKKLERETIRKIQIEIERPRS